MFNFVSIEDWYCFSWATSTLTRTRLSFFVFMPFMIPLKRRFLVMNWSSDSYVCSIKMSINNLQLSYRRGFSMVSGGLSSNFTGIPSADDSSVHFTWNVSEMGAFIREKPQYLIHYNFGSKLFKIECNFLWLIPDSFEKCLLISPNWDDRINWFFCRL